MHFTFFCFHDDVGKYGFHSVSYNPNFIPSDVLTAMLFSPVLFFLLVNVTHYYLVVLVVIDKHDRLHVLNGIVLVLSACCHDLYMLLSFLSYMNKLVTGTIKLLYHNAEVVLSVCLSCVLK
jgi:hypothetical protein